MIHSLFLMAKLSEDQLQKISQWVQEGASLSVIQGKLASEFGISMTFLDVRLLVDDLNLILQEKEEPKKENDQNSSIEENTTPSLETGTPTKPAAGVKVEVDAINRPGTMVSGNVTFSDGQIADWYLDMEGRPGLAPRTPGYRPSQGDIMDFQVKLDAALRQAGY